MLTMFNCFFLLRLECCNVNLNFVLLFFINKEYNIIHYFTRQGMSIIMNISKTDNGGQIVVEYFKIGRARQAPGKRPRLRRIYMLDQEEGYCLTKVHKGGPFLK